MTKKTPDLLVPVSLSSPLSLALAALFIVAGIGAVLSGGPIWTVVPPAVSWILIGLTIAGGAGIALGVAWRGVEHVGRGIERAGHYLSTAVWLSIALLTWAEHGLLAPGLSGLQALVIAFGTLGRARALKKVDRAVEKAERARTGSPEA